jgi:parallel beta-helix repeat protein
MRRLAIMSCIAWMSLGTWATNYYVSPTGSGSNYTESSPGKLTSTVIGKLKAGDVLYLMGGQYDFQNTLSINRSGTADKMITICPYNDERPILDFRQEANKTNGVKVGGSYLHIKGITIRYAGYKGIWLEDSQYCILEQLDVYGCCNAGIQLRSGGYNTVVNCDSHDNFDYQDDGGNADGFADKQGNACPGNVYIGCRSWNNSDDGWDSYGRITSGTPTVYINCITYNNGPATFDLSAHPRVLGKDATLSCFSGKDLKNFANGGNPNGFKVGGNGTKHDVELYRCLAVGHRKKGFDQNNNAGNMKVINCTAYDNDINYGFGNDQPFTLAVYNNISLAPRSSHWKRSDSGTTTQQHNSWNGDSKPWAASESDFEGLDIESIINAPRQADGSLAETTQFHLKSTATHLIDQGVSYTDFSGDQISDYVSYKGEAPDLGCYEYDTSSGIQATIVKGSDLNPNMPRYNIKGQQVDSNYKGLVIQGGKKYIQK